MRCALCGFEFDPRETACAKGCPLGRTCSLTRCPSCGYEFPCEPRSFAWLRRLFRRRRRVVPQNGGMIALPDLADGETAELVCWSGANPKRRNSLAVYGVVPGCQIVLQQKRPAFVIRVGETELALEEAIAREFVVRRLTPEPEQRRE